jgi:hypothetical protein
MRSLGKLFLFASAVAMTSLCHGQAPEDENVHYDNLKVLEPMIGTWQFKFGDADAGAHGVWETSFAWTPNKRTIATMTRNRRADKGENITTKDWLTKNVGMYVWNTELGCIESYDVDQETGVAFVSKLCPTGEGAFEFEHVRASALVGTVRTTLKCVGDELYWAFLNRTSPTGEPQPDIHGLFKRVSPAVDQD